MSASSARIAITILAALALSSSACWRNSYDVQCVAGDDGIQLSWTPEPASDHYRVYRVVAGGEIEPVGEAQGPAWLDASVDGGTEYHYIVRPIGPDGLDFQGAGQCSVTAAGSSGPDPVGAPICRAKSGKVDLLWEPVADAVSYRVLRAPAASGFETLGEIASPPFADFSVVDGNAYEYAVVAIGADGGAAAQSPSCTATPGPNGGGDPPDPVADLSCRGKRDKVDLAWSAVADAAFYRVFRTVGGATTELGEVVSPVFADFGVVPSAAHDYVVRAVAADGSESADSAVCSYAATDRDGGNQPPSITSEPVTNALERSQYRYDVVATDPEGGAITLSIAQAPPGMYFEGDSQTLVWRPVAEQIGPHTIELRATDPLGAYTTQAFVVSAADWNEPPRITSVPRTQAQAGERYEYDVDAFDPEQGALAFSFAQPAPPGMTIDPATGVVGWTPAAMLAAQTVVVRATDPGGAFEDQTFALVVTQDPLVLTAPEGEVHVEVGETLELRFQSNYPNARYGARPLPPGATQQGDVLRFAPTPGSAGRYELIAKATLGDMKDSNSLVVVVTDPNAAPVFGALGPFSVAEGGLLRVPVTATDPDGDALIFAAPGLALENAVFDEFSRELVFQPSFEQAGDYDVVLTVGDGAAIVETHVAITVTDAEPPVGDLELVVNPPQSPTFVRGQTISGSVIGEVASVATPLAALVTGLAPTNVQQGRAATIAITGRNTQFVSGEIGATFGDGVVVDSITVTSPTQATVNVSVSPTAPVGVRQMRVRSGGQEIPSVVAFRVEAGAAVVSGRLVDEFTGQPLVGVRVTVNGTNVSAVTGADGSFEIVGVPPGAQTLVAVAPNFDVLEFGVQVEENATYALEEPIGLAALARPALPGGSLPRAQTLASVLDRGASAIGEPLSQAQAEMLVSDTMIAVGTNQLGVMDETGAQLNPRIAGHGLLSLTPASVRYFAQRLRDGQVYTLRQVGYAIHGSFGWVFEGLELDYLIADLQRAVNAAWRNASDPDYALAIVIFNPDATSLSPEPPVLTPDTRLNSLQAFLLFSSFVARHLPVLDMAIDQKLEDLGIDPRELLEDAGIDADRYAAQSRPGAATRLAEHMAGWVGIAGDLAFGAPAHAQSGDPPVGSDLGGVTGGVANVFTWKTARAALISGVAGVILAGAVVLGLALCGIAGPLAAFSVLGTFLVGALTTVFAKFIGGVFEDRNLPLNLAPQPPAVVSQYDPSVESPNFLLRFRRSENDLESDALRRANPDLGPNWTPDFSGWIDDAWNYAAGDVDRRLLDHRYVLWKFPCNPDSTACHEQGLDAIAGRQPFARQSSLAHQTKAELDAEANLPVAPGYVDPMRGRAYQFEQFRIPKKDLAEGANYFRIQTLQFYRRIWTLDQDPDRDLWVTKEDVGIVPPEFATFTARGETFRGNVLGELGRLTVETPLTLAGRVRQGRTFELEQMRANAQRRSAIAARNRAMAGLDAQKILELGPEVVERDAKAALDALQAKTDLVRPQIEAHGEIGTATVDRIAEEGVSTRSVDEIIDDLLDPSTPRGQQLDAILAGRGPNARVRYREYVGALLNQQRVQATIASHNDAILQLRQLDDGLVAGAAADPNFRVPGQQRRLPGFLSVNPAVAPAPIPTSFAMFSSDTVEQARGRIQQAITRQETEIRRLTGLMDPANSFSSLQRNRIRRFQAEFFDANQWTTDFEDLTIAKARFEEAQHLVQLERDVAEIDVRRAEIGVRGFDPTTPKGFAGVQEGLQSRALMRDVNSGWKGVRGSFGFDVGNFFGLAAEVTGEIHALRDDVDVLQSALSRTIVVDKRTLGTDPITGLPRVEVTTGANAQASHLPERPISIASRFGETPEPELPQLASGFARGPLARLFARPMAITDAGVPVTPVRRPQASRRVAFTGPSGLPIQFEPDPDLGQMLGVLFPSAPPPDNPRAGYLFRDFPFSPPQAERYDAGFPSELIAVDSQGRVYLENYNSNEEFGGRVFRFAGMPPQREHVGSIQYFSQTLMYAHPAFPIAMEIGDSISAEFGRVEDLFIAHKDLGVYFDPGRTAVNRVLKLAVHQADRLPAYANGQNRNRLVAQPWAEHPDFRFDGPTDIEADARDPASFADGTRPLYMSDADSLYVLRDVDHDGSASVAKIAQVPGRVFAGIASDQNGNLFVADNLAGEVYLIPQRLLDDVVAGASPPFSSDADLDGRAFLIKVGLDRPGDVELDTFEHRYMVSTPDGLVAFDIPAVGRIPSDLVDMNVDSFGSEFPVQLRRDRGGIFEVGANSEGTFAGKVLRLRTRRVDPATGRSSWSARSVRTALFGATVLRDDALLGND